jgi:hypothetical protein
MAQAQSAAAVPYTVRWLETLPVAPGWVGLALALVLLGVYLGIESVMGRIELLRSGQAPQVLWEDFRVGIVLILFLGYLPAALAQAVRGARRDFDALVPALRGTPRELAALREEVGRFDARALRVAGCMGVALGLVIPFAIEPRSLTWSLGPLGPEATLHRVMSPIVLWHACRFLYAMVQEARRFSRIGREWTVVDLADPSALRPFSDFGLRMSLLSLGLLALLLLFVKDIEVSPYFYLVMLTGGAASLLLAAAGLLLPARGLRSVIVEKKRTELAWLTHEIRQARDALQGEALEDGERGRLADLVAYRHLVESAREWPVDASTLTRAILYLAIPLGSWLGGAFVERLVDALLD